MDPASVDPTPIVPSSPTTESRPRQVPRRVRAARAARDRARRLWVRAVALGFAKWVLILLAVLTFGGLVSIGFLTITRGTPVAHIRALTASGVEAAAPSIDDPMFPRTIAFSTGLQLTRGNAVRVFADGDGTYPALWRDLRNARRSITVQMYYGMPGAVADSMRDVLIARSREGVKVLVLLDAFGTQNLGDGWSDSLKRAGAEVSRLRPLTWHRIDRAGHRSHVRVVVVDGTIGWTGGFGLADYWLGDGRSPGAWRETNVRFEGPATLQLQAAFAAAWAEARRELIAGDFFFPEESVVPAGSVQAGLHYLVPSGGSTSGERFLALTLAAARRSLFISNSYFLPDDDFRTFLCQARARGVDVRVLTASTETDIKSVYYAGRHRYPELFRCGVRIWEYAPSMMHAKTIVADGRWVAIGSMNFDNRSLALNEEANLVALDAGLGATMDSLFHEDLRYSSEITPAAFAKRPWWHRVLEQGATLFARVM